jgi:hypothetical protein
MEKSTLSLKSVAPNSLGEFHSLRNNDILCKPLRKAEFEEDVESLSKAKCPLTIEMWRALPTSNRDLIASIRMQKLKSGGGNPFNAGVKKIVGYDNEGDKREGEKDASSDAAHSKSDIMKEDNDPTAQGEEDVSGESKAVIPPGISKNNDEDEKREGEKDVSGDAAFNKSEVEENNDPAVQGEEDVSGDSKKAVITPGISKNDNEDEKREGEKDASDGAALNKSEVEENNDPAAQGEEDTSGDSKKAVVPPGISKNDNEDREGIEDDSSESSN